MKRRLIGGAVALAIALAAVLVPSPAPARAASSSCTGWTSSLYPPTTIRVYRTSLKKTVTVPFRSYVEAVMAAEWGPTHPAAALQAGALAVKQYGWYYARVGHWRGGKDSAGHCYDVSSSTVDQFYDPARKPAASHKAAIAVTWTWSLRRNNIFILTGYRPGTGVCGAPVDGLRLYQRDASNCASKYNWTAEQILRRYYGSATRPVELVIPGLDDMTGDGRGDVAGVVTDPPSGDVSVNLYTTDPMAVPTSAPAATPTAGTVLGGASTDVDADGKTDLVELVAVSDDTVALQVRKANGTGFDDAATWWTSTPGQFVPGELRFVAGDFNADRKGDAGIVRVTGGDAPVTELWVATSTGTAFGPTLRSYLAGAQDRTAAVFQAGDFTGDGRADLAILRPGDPPDEATTTLTEVAASQTSLLLVAPKTWATETAPLDAIRPIVGDFDRNGRDDLMLQRPGSAGEVRFLGYISTGTTFTRRWFWSAASPNFPWASSSAASADLNRDGRSDIVLFVDRGIDADGASLGVDVERFTSTGTSFTLSFWRTDPGVTWSTLQPY